MKINFYHNNQSNLTKKAISIIKNFIENEGFVLNDNKDISVYLGLNNDNIIQKSIREYALSICDVEQGYTVRAGKGEDGMDVVICAKDEQGILYGAVDFCNKYLGRYMWRAGHNDIMKSDFFQKVNSENLPEWRTTSFPSIPRRAIWTWGHVVYDYKRFIDNMVMLKLNELVLWNDHVPLNASEIVDYAHKNGIKVIWGYAWGWDVDCAQNDITDEYLRKVQESVISKYVNDYKNKGDGIYFQSFTELHVEEINGKCIASVVTDFVNDTSRKLLEITPDLEIQFGLHATSVKNHLDSFTKLDSRVRIVWEDCGSFPYSYDPFDIDSFDSAMLFTDKLLSLRENERFGAVLKGQTNLDWRSFSHLNKSDRIGECDIEFIKDRASQKAKLWKVIQSYWVQNGDVARKLIQKIATNKHAVVEMLVEDGCFEYNINPSTALCAEYAWNPNRSHEEILGEVSAYPCVKSN